MCSSGYHIKSAPFLSDIPKPPTQPNMSAQLARNSSSTVVLTPEELVKHVSTEMTFIPINAKKRKAHEPPRAGAETEKIKKARTATPVPGGSPGNSPTTRVPGGSPGNSPANLRNLRAQYYAKKFAKGRTRSADQ